MAGEAHMTRDQADGTVFTFLSVLAVFFGIIAMITGNFFATIFALAFALLAAAMKSGQETNG